MSAPGTGMEALHHNVHDFLALQQSQLKLAEHVRGTVKPVVLHFGTKPHRVLHSHGELDNEPQMYAVPGAHFMI